MSFENNSKSRKRSRWHYQPDVPVKTSPLFSQPFDALKIASWFIRGWFPFTANTLVLLISLMSWYFFHPALEICRNLEWSWVGQIFLRNLILISVLAGGLHWFFYGARKQRDDRHYDPRPFMKKNRVFTFNNQIFDNIFWTCASGVTIWTGLEVFMMWAMANEYITQLFWPEHAGWIILLIFLVPIWETFYFYLIHRMLHWPWLYKHVHSLHHRNTNIGPWSGLSMHPVEHVIYLGSVLIHWVIPANPLIIIFHLQHYTLTAVTTHTGYEGILIGKKIRLALGTFHHQIHHRYFDCNYGGLEIPWDKWMGSFNDGTEESHRAFLESRSPSSK